MISFGRSCRISVSSFVRHTSSSNALRLNSLVALSSTHTPKHWRSLPSSPSASRIDTQCPAWSSVSSSASTRVPFVYTLLSSRRTILSLPLSSGVSLPFAFPPLDACGRPRARAACPPVVGAQSGPDG